MAADPGKEETPVPGTAAEDGRRKLGAYETDTPSIVTQVQDVFYTSVSRALSVERLESYGGDGVGSTITLARYLLNLALCESLYSPLQLCEVALRNSLHRHLTSLCHREDWFEASSQFPMTSWAIDEVTKAKDKITRAQKAVTAGRVVAELQLGFWTSLFEAHYEQRTRFLPWGIKPVFPHLPKSGHNRKALKRKLEEIRVLRNRVFHHERIVHWTDLEAKHAAILEVIGWVSPELHEMARALDRFTEIRKAGLPPWIEKLCHHWPHGK